jgi:predicted double-glycine peptidase
VIHLKQINPRGIPVGIEKMVAKESVQRRDTMKNLEGLLCLLAVVTCFGCATLPPGTPGTPPLKRSEITETNLPGSVMIENVPAILQGPSQCGPTSLAMVAGYFGKEITKDQIARETMAAGRKGVQPYHLTAAAKDLGFSVYQFFDRTKDKNHIKFYLAQGYPLIVEGTIPAKWHRNRSVSTMAKHFIVLIGYNNEGFWINDPASRKHPILIPYGMFAEFHWTEWQEIVLAIFPDSAKQNKF